MPHNLTWRQAIETVLRESRCPLHYNEIAEQIVSMGLRQKVGATPAATVNSQISASMSGSCV